MRCSMRNFRIFILVKVNEDSSPSFKASRSFAVPAGVVCVKWIHDNAFCSLNFRPTEGTSLSVSRFLLRPQVSLYNDHEFRLTCQAMRQSVQRR